MVRFKQFIIVALVLNGFFLSAQSRDNVSVDLDTRYQTMEGFGAALAYYENWLTAHPNKAEVYEAIFGELSLDILRYRNAYDYDETMIDRAVEFYEAAEESLGHPIKILSTSWGPPAYLKSNNDKSNGGSLRYTIDGGTVVFDYEGFANWWAASLDEYNANGIYPDFISLQNEPDYLATWESCLFQPTERINSQDTIAGYDKALEAIYDMIQQRNQKPKIIGPETIGIGYNSVQNYMNALNPDYLDGIAHHLYHGVDENDPWVSDDFTKVGELHPEIPHYQTEYSRGDWFSLAGLMYKSFHDENAVAYMYWDLIWDGAGLVDLEFPWSNADWTTEKGYIKTKEFYAFKQYSAFIHPGWVRLESTSDNDNVKSLAFTNTAGDSITMVLANKSQSQSYDVRVVSGDFSILESEVYRTSGSEDCATLGALEGVSDLSLPAESITTIVMAIGEGEIMNIGENELTQATRVYPNPFSQQTTIVLPQGVGAYKTLTLFDINGRVVREMPVSQLAKKNNEITFQSGVLKAGWYQFVIDSESEEPVLGRLVVKN